MAARSRVMQWRPARMIDVCLPADQQLCQLRVAPQTHQHQGSLTVRIANIQLCLWMFGNQFKSFE